jgi:hypothetical protein
MEFLLSLLTSPLLLLASLSGALVFYVRSTLRSPASL